MIFTVIIPDIGIASFELESLQKVIDTLNDGDSSLTEDSISYLLASVGLSTFLEQVNGWDEYLSKMGLSDEQGNTVPVTPEARQKIIEGCKNLTEELTKAYPDKVKNTFEISDLVKEIYTGLKSENAEDAKLEKEYLDLLLKPKGDA